MRRDLWPTGYQAKPRVVDMDLLSLEAYTRMNTSGRIQEKGWIMAIDLRTPKANFGLFHLDSCPSTSRVCPDLQAQEDRSACLRWIKMLQLRQVRNQSTPPCSENLSVSNIHTTRDRIVRAFLIEEQKIVKKVLKEQSQSEKKK